MKRMKKKPQHNNREKPRFCDPAACRNCEHIGGGTFVCTYNALDPIGVVVVQNWKATAKHLHCKRRYDRPRERR